MLTGPEPRRQIARTKQANAAMIPSGPFISAVPAVVEKYKTSVSGLHRPDSVLWILDVQEKQPKFSSSG
jgi:hypothetical protein